MTTYTYSENDDLDDVNYVEWNETGISLIYRSAYRGVFWYIESKSMYEQLSEELIIEPDIYMIEQSIGNEKKTYFIRLTKLKAVIWNSWFITLTFEHNVTAHVTCLHRDFFPSLKRDYHVLRMYLDTHKDIPVAEIVG